jgi:hypothetical protein
MQKEEFKEFKRIKQSFSKDKYGQLVFLADWHNSDDKK